MKNHLTVLTLGVLLVPSFALGADHLDSPATRADPAADITDVLAWMSADAENLNLVMAVSPFATTDSTLSPAVQYVFHVNSSMGYGMAQTETNVICQLYTETNIECWAGGEYVNGDPSDPAGITSASGQMRVFAGLRDDPFFFEFEGFVETTDIVKGAAAGLTFDPAGCPQLDAATGEVLRAQLQGGPPPMMGGTPTPASDTFEGGNVIAIVIQLNKSVVTGGGPLLAVWGSTHQAP